METGINTQGTPQIGWLQQGNDWYFLAPSGEMVSGGIEVDGKIYYLGAPESGKMETGQAETRQRRQAETRQRRQAETRQRRQAETRQRRQADPRNRIQAEPQRLEAKKPQWRPQMTNKQQRIKKCYMC